MASLVIGGSGVIGMSLCAELVRRGVEVVATSRNPKLSPRIPGVAMRGLRLARFERWDRLLKGIDTVYHLAWSTIPSSAVLDPAHDLADNVVGTLRLLEAARKSPGIRVVFASSGGTVYGPSASIPTSESEPCRPQSAFGLSKLATERYLENYREMYGLESVSLRLGNCYGAQQTVKKGLGAVTLFLRAVLNKQPITVFGAGDVVRDYIHVGDVVEAMIAAGDRRGVTGPFNVGSGIGHSLRDVIGVIERVTGMPVNVQRVAARPFDVPSSVLDVSRASERLDWVPRITLEDGIGRVAAELRGRAETSCASLSSYTATSRTTSTARRPTRDPSRENSKVSVMTSGSSRAISQDVLRRNSL